MSVPGGEPVNMAYFDSVIARIESCGTCADIQAALDDATGSVQIQLNSLTEKLAVLQPYIALMTMPGANPGAIVTYLQDLATATIEPMLKPIITIPLQLAAYATLPAKFIAAAEAAKDRLPSCSITPPTVEVPPIPAPVLDYARLKMEGL